MKNRKILFTVLFVLLFILISCSRCFASTIPDNMQQFGDENTYFLVFKDKDEKVFLVSFAEQANSNDGSWFWGTGDCIRIYEYVNNAWELKLDNKSETSYSYFETGPYRRYLTVSNYGRSVEIVGSNYDVVKTDDNSQIFFPKTPLENGIVAQAVEQVEMSQVQAEILGILPMTLVVLVSLVGLRKALKMLETFLHRS